MRRAETCTWCRFDSRDWTTADLVGTLTALGPWWRELTRCVDPHLLGLRPAATTWSALEYAVHSRDIIAVHGRLLHAILTIDDLEVRGDPPPDARPDDPPVTASWDAVVQELEANATRLAGRAVKLGDAEWNRTAVLDGERIDAADVVAHAVHDATHHLIDVGRGLRALGATPVAGIGRVAQINVSAGGVPKRAVAAARVAKAGIEGDRQATRKHHGRPWQALCLWSGDVIERLRAEGHPVEPGAAGENVTITGLDWAQIRPGVRMRVGDALVETSLYALPCAKNARWFVDGDFRRMEHTRERGVSRIYAWVLVDGDVRTGDPVVVEPATADLTSG
jgi:MOSC domain-containing protein YiiM